MTTEIDRELVQLRHQQQQENNSGAAGVYKGLIQLLSAGGGMLY